MASQEKPRTFPESLRWIVDFWGAATLFIDVVVSQSMKDKALILSVTSKAQVQLVSVWTEKKSKRTPWVIFMRQRYYFFFEPQKQPAVLTFYEYLKVTAAVTALDNSDTKKSWGRVTSTIRMEVLFEPSWTTSSFQAFCWIYIEC